jgi:hypothetical protein
VNHQNCKGSPFSIHFTYVQEKSVTAIRFMVSFGYVHTINIPQSTYVSVRRTRTVSAEHGCHLRFPSAEHGSFLKLIRISPNSIFPRNVCGKRYCLRFTEIILPPLRQNPVHECTDTHHGRIFSSCPDFAGIYHMHSKIPGY